MAKQSKPLTKPRRPSRLNWGIAFGTREGPDVRELWCYGCAAAQRLTGRIPHGPADSYEHVKGCRAIAQNEGLWAITAAMRRAVDRLRAETTSPMLASHAQVVAATVEEYADQIEAELSGQGRRAACDHLLAQQFELEPGVTAYRVRWCPTAGCGALDLLDGEGWRLPTEEATNAPRV